MDKLEKHAFIKIKKNINYHFFSYLIRTNLFNLIEQN